MPQGFGLDSGFELHGPGGPGGSLTPGASSVYRWFGALGPSSRLEFACGLLDLVNPLELRFLAACLEELARKDYHSLRDAEARANNAADVMMMDVAGGGGYEDDGGGGDGEGGGGGGRHRVGCARGVGDAAGHGSVGVVRASDGDVIGGVGLDGSAGTLVAPGGHGGAGATAGRAAAGGGGRHRGLPLAASARSRLVVSAALLRSDNREAASALYAALGGAALAEDGDEDEGCDETLKLLLTMAVNHPAFSFQQKRTLRRRLAALQRGARAAAEQQQQLAQQQQQAAASGEESDAGQQQQRAKTTPKRKVAGPEGESLSDDTTSTFSSQDSPSYGGGGGSGSNVTAASPPYPASIERIERKNLSKRKGERCTEYYLEVFWSDGSTVTLSKTYQELHDFLSKLPQIFPNDHLERLFPPPPARGATAFSTHRTNSSTERPTPSAERALPPRSPCPSPSPSAPSPTRNHDRSACGSRSSPTRPHSSAGRDVRMTMTTSVGAAARPPTPRTRSNSRDKQAERANTPSSAVGGGGGRHARPRSRDERHGSSVAPPASYDGRANGVEERAERAEWAPPGRIVSPGRHAHGRMRDDMTDRQRCLPTRSPTRSPLPTEKGGGAGGGRAVVFHSPPVHGEKRPVDVEAAMRSLPGGPTASPDHGSVGCASPQLALAGLPPASPTSRHGDAAPGPHGSEVVGVLDWLKKLRLHKYYPEFKHLSMEQFLNLSEEDVDLFENLTEGAKKKLRTQLAKERAEKFGGVSESYPLSNGVTRVPSSHHSPTHNSRHNPVHNAQRSPSINSSRRADDAAERSESPLLPAPGSRDHSQDGRERAHRNKERDVSGARDGSTKEKPPTFPSHPINQAICIMRPTAQVTPVQNPSVPPPLLAPHSTPYSACPSSLSSSHPGSHPGLAHVVGRRKENTGGFPLPPELPGADGPAHGTGEIRLGGGGGGGRFISASPLVHLGSPALPSGFASRGKAAVTAFGNGSGGSGGSGGSSSNSSVSNSSRSSMESPEMSRLLPQPVPVQASRQDDCATAGGPGSPYIFTGGGNPQHQQQQHGKTPHHEHLAPATQQQHAPQQAPPLHLYAVESDAFPPSGKLALAGAKLPASEATAPAVMPGGVLAGGYCTTRGAFPAHGAGAGSGGGVLLTPIYNGGGGSEAELNGTGLGAPSHQHQQQHQQSCCSSCSSCGCSGGCGGTRGLPLSYPYFQPFSTPFIGFPVIPMSSAMYGSFVGAGGNQQQHQQQQHQQQHQQQQHQQQQHHHQQPHAQQQQQGSYGQAMAQQPTVGGHANQAAAAFYIPSPAPFPGHEPGSLGTLTGMALPYQRAVSDAYLFHQHHHGQHHVVQQQQQQQQHQQHQQQHVQPALHYQYSVGPRRHGGLPTLSCYNCGACGHRASECKHPTMDTNQQGTFRLKYAPSSENVDSSD